MSRPRLASALAAALVLATGAPALAQEGDETAFDQRVSLEWQSWSFTSPAGNGLQYTSPMTVLTIVDHTGAVAGAFTTVAANEARRQSAERDAIRKGERTYTYEHHEGRALQGSRTSFQVGVGGINGATTVGTGAVAPAAGQAVSMLQSKIAMEGDMFELFGGVFVIEGGVAYWGTVVPADGTKPRGYFNNVAAWNYPLGLRWRYAPAFLPGLVIEPGASFDWLYTAYYATQGGARWDARNMGVEVGYYPFPRLKVRAGYHLNRLAHEDIAWMKREDVVDMKNASLGVTLNF